MKANPSYWSTNFQLCDAVISSSLLFFIETQSHFAIAITTLNKSKKSKLMSSNSSSNSGRGGAGAGAGAGARARASLRLKNLAQQLRLYKHPPPSHDEEASASIARTKRAAVLICLFEDDAGDVCVILTKRSSKLSKHSGEVSLPGGKVDEGDANDVETALREAKEEIGLDPSLVNVVAVLQPFRSLHGLTVIPVIGILSDKKLFKPVLNAEEVEAVFTVSLDMFLKNNNRMTQEGDFMGGKYLVHFFDCKADDTNFVIWGLTAGILVRAASVVFQRPPSFPEQNPYPKIPRPVDKETTKR